MKVLSFILAVTLASCGSNETKIERTDKNNQSEIDKLKAQVQALIGTQSHIDSLINSEFSTCDSNAGATQDVLIRKICNVSKAATSETRVQMMGQLSSFSQMLGSQISAVNLDIIQLQTDVSAESTARAAAIASIQSQINTINTTITTIQGQITSMQSAISALETLTNSINGVISTNLLMVEIGTENASAGPLYENLLVRQDRARINGYVEALTAAVAISNNGLNATNGSPTVTVTTSSAHGFVAGNIVRMSGLSSGRGFVSSDLVDDYVIQTVPTGTTFTITLPRNASSNGTLGGSSGSVQKVSGRGMGTIWTNSQASDSAVRQTNFGSRAYNFIIKKGLTGAATASDGYICYDKTDRSATFATINAATAVGTSGNLICK